MFPPLAVVFKNNTVNNTVIITKKTTIKLASTCKSSFTGLMVNFEFQIFECSTLLTHVKHHVHFTYAIVMYIPII